MALGSGLGSAPTFTLATAVDDSAKGAASGLVTTTQELSAAVGLTVLTTVGLLLATPTGPVTQLTYAAAAVVGALSVVAAMVAGRSAPVRDASPDTVRG